MIGCFVGNIGLMWGFGMVMLGYVNVFEYF